MSTITSGLLLDVYIFNLYYFLMPKRLTRAVWKDAEARSRRDQLILMLRFRTLTPTHDSPAFVGYSVIGKMLHLSHQRVREIC